MRALARQLERRAVDDRRIVGAFSLAESSDLGIGLRYAHSGSFAARPDDDTVTPSRRRATRPAVRAWRCPSATRADGARCATAPRSSTMASAVNSSAMSVCCSTRTMAMLAVGQHQFHGGDQFIDDHRRQALERLVQQQQRRIGHQRARDRQHLLLAAGQLIAHVARGARPGAETA